MKRAWVFVLLALAVVLGTALYLIGSKPSDSSPGASPVPTTEPLPVAATEGSGEPALAAAEPALVAAEPATAADREIAPATTPADAPSPSPTRCRIFGRVVDESGAPLPGIQVMLHSAGGPWAKDVRLPKTQWNGHELEALAPTTDAEGRFSVEEVVPTSDWISLFIRPEPFLGLFSRNFGPAGGRNEPRLVAGENDLGDIVLATTGAVEGFVRGADGAALANAEVDLHGAFPGGLVVTTRAEADGSYLLGNVPPGTWRFQAEAKGRLSAESDPLEVRPREIVRGIDFRLESAPTISGVVVDESGRPVPRVRIQGWPRSSGQGAGGRSGDDGSFTLFLPQNEPYRLEIEHEGFETYGGFGSSPVAPGTTDCRIVLERGNSMTFVVVDASSGDPIPRYGIEVEEVEGDGWTRSENTSPLRVADHPGGEHALVLPRGKAVVHVEAPDHAPFGGDVVEDEPGSRRQTIRLAPGSSLSGRVLRGGTPVASVRAILERCSVKIDASQPDEPPEERYFSDNYRFDLSPFVGRSREVVSGTDGGFRFDSLAAGTYSLTLRESSSAPWIRDGLKLGAEGHVDLGDVALEAGSTIHGRLVLPPGRSSQDWEVVLDDWTQDNRVETDAGGRFRFEGLQPGRHELHLRPPGEHDSTFVREVDLPAGTTVEIELDGSPFLPCELRVRVTRAGKPLPGIVVFGICELPDGKSGRELEPPTDPDGRTNGKVAPCNSLRILASSPTGLRIGKSASAVDLPPDGVVEVEIEVTAGEVVLVFPEGFEVPARATAHVMFRSPGSDGQPEIQSLGISTADSPLASGSIVWQSRVVDLGVVSPGDYQVNVSVNQLEASESSPVHRSKTVAAFHGRIRVETDGRAECALAPGTGN